MRDRREEALVRLVAICEATPGVVLVARNRIDVGRTQKPCLIVMDGDESTSESPEVDRHRPNASNERFEMSPEIVIMAGGDSDTNVGTVLSGFRRQLIRTVTTDATLSEITGRNGYVRYRGNVTDLARGREMEGTMVLTFVLRYLLKVEELT